MRNFINVLITCLGISVVVLFLSLTCVDMESQSLVDTQKILIQAADLNTRIICYSFKHHDDEPVQNYPKTPLTKTFSHTGSVTVGSVLPSTTTTL